MPALIENPLIVLLMARIQLCESAVQQLSGITRAALIPAEHGNPPREALAKALDDAMREWSVANGNLAGEFGREAMKQGQEAASANENVLILPPHLRKQ